MLFSEAIIVGALVPQVVAGVILYNVGRKLLLSVERVRKYGSPDK